MPKRKSKKTLKRLASGITLTEAKKVKICSEQETFDTSFLKNESQSFIDLYTIQRNRMTEVPFVCPSDSTPDSFFSLAESFSLFVSSHTGENVSGVCVLVVPHSFSENNGIGRIYGQVDLSNEDSEFANKCGILLASWYLRQLPQVNVNVSYEIITDFDVQDILTNDVISQELNRISVIMNEVVLDIHKVDSLICLDHFMEYTKELAVKASNNERSVIFNDVMWSIPENSFMFSLRIDLND
ncbi:hypothetical protein RCL1_002910 [Eukaryota sp. TZLM3-RCL]